MRERYSSCCRAPASRRRSRSTTRAQEGLEAVDAGACRRRQPEGDRQRQLSAEQGQRARVRARATCRDCGADPPKSRSSDPEHPDGQPVSPLAPRIPCRLPPHRRRAHRDGRGRHQVPGPHRRPDDGLRPPAAVAGVFTRSQCPSAPVDFCRAATCRPAGARPRGQFRQRQRLHRQEGRRGDAR